MKKLCAFCLAAALMIALAACAGKDTSKISESTAETTESAAAEVSTTAQESIAEESTSDDGSEQLKAALSAYREQLEANKAQITNEDGAAYTYPSKPISFADVTGDGVPELFYTYEEAAGYMGIFSIYTVVYAYSDDGLYQLLEPAVYQNGNADVCYNMYFTAGSSLYLMKYSDGGNVRQNNLELIEYKYDAADGTMTCRSAKECSYLTEAGKAVYKDVQGWTDNSVHEADGSEITADECTAGNAQVFNSISAMIIGSPDESSIQKCFEEDEHLGFAGAFADLDNISMTYDEAIAYIDGM